MAQTHSHAEMLATAKTDHLLLLVGGNPLPNAIAAKLLVVPRGTITLIHSRGATGTADVAQRLRSWLDGQGVTCHLKLKEVEESNPISIMQGVRACLEATKAQRVGLNYTGGTKAMSVHAYRTVEQWAKERNVTPVFSYLDARTLEMVFDPIGIGSSEQRIYIGLAVKMELTDLLRLHRWTPKHQPTRMALLPRTAHTLASALATDDGFKHWQQWIASEFRPNCRRRDKEDWKSKNRTASGSFDSAFKRIPRPSCSVVTVGSRRSIRRPRTRAQRFRKRAEAFV